jgi:hypothetical protein
MTYDASHQPMCSLRDLIALCEATFTERADLEILAHAQAGFSTLRALQGDIRPAEAIADTETMIEPRAGDIDLALAALARMPRTPAVS